ncbi:MAG: 2-hydroxyacyl-CoA dehydratase [Candidatus Tectomicrobia bacterium]|uniref:2-hydroxyacyl-CoA dehydratase n=1 Tax=Tectimicrobiota bacterium TaxID=2528274 RepID=A0A932CQ73_UNCTE|nr:2-hydroxyacyl-CoA dehydratase [Candidatus Tectomicrobia bacterium]
MGETKLAKIQELVEIYRGGLEQASQSPNPEDQVTALVMSCLADYLQETLRVARERDKQIAWFMLAMPSEILLAMGIHPYPSELLVGILPTVKPDGLKEYIQIAEQAGLPSEMCSVDKGTLGLLLSGQLPEPDFIVGANFPCDNIVIGYQMYANLLKVPTYHSDAPYGAGEDDLDYFSGEIRRVIAFMEEQTGRRMDYDRLRELLEESNRAAECLIEINELRKKIPCPLSGRLLPMIPFLNAFASGDPRQTEFYRRIRDAVRQCAEQGIGPVPEEKNRVVWFMVPTYFDMELFPWMEQQFGAVIAMDMFSYGSITPVDTSSIDRMIRGLALKALNFPMMRQLRGPVEFYTDDLIRVCEEYQADSVIYAGHEGCKQGWGIVGLIRDTCKEIGRPLLVFDMDAFGGSPHAAAEVRRKIAEFFHTLAAVPA